MRSGRNFLTQKKHALPNQFRNLLSSEKDVTDKNKIYQELGRFNKNLFIGKWKFQKEDIDVYLSQINIPILTEEQPQTCEGPITEFELLNPLKVMIYSPRNKSLTKEFYKTFQEEMKISLCNSITKSYQNNSTT